MRGCRSSVSPGCLLPLREAREGDDSSPETMSARESGPLSDAGVQIVNQVRHDTLTAHTLLGWLYTGNTHSPIGRYNLMMYEVCGTEKKSAMIHMPACFPQSKDTRWVIPPSHLAHRRSAQGSPIRSPRMQALYVKRHATHREASHIAREHVPSRTIMALSAGAVWRFRVDPGMLAINREVFGRPARLVLIPAFGSIDEQRIRETYVPRRRHLGEVSAKRVVLQAPFGPGRSSPDLQGQRGSEGA